MATLAKSAIDAAILPDLPWLNQVLGGGRIQRWN